MILYFLIFINYVTKVRQVHGMRFLILLLLRKLPFLFHKNVNVRGIRMHFYKGGAYVEQYYINVSDIKSE